MFQTLLDAAVQMMQQYSVAASVSSVSFNRGPVVPPAAENASNAANGPGAGNAVIADNAEGAANAEIVTSTRNGAAAGDVSEGVPSAADCVAKGGLVFAETKNNNLNFEIFSFP